MTGMNVWAFIFFLIATILFSVEFFRSQWQNLIALGLAFLSLGFIFEFATKAHTISF